MRELLNPRVNYHESLSGQWGVRTALTLQWAVHTNPPGKKLTERFRQQYNQIASLMLQLQENIPKDTKEARK